MFKQTLCFLLLTTTAVLGGDSSTSEFLGFSADGNYVAFQRYGAYDGTGVPYSEIFIIDVLKNEFAIAPIRSEGSSEDDPEMPSETEADTNARNQVNAQTVLKQFGINDSLHTKIDFQHEQAGDRWRQFFEWSGKRYEVVLQTTPYSDPSCEEVMAPQTPRIFEVALVQGQHRKTLQKDQRLPRSRGCAYEYYPERFIYVYKNRLALFVVFLRLGFEGPDVRQILVTGDLNFGA